MITDAERADAAAALAAAGFLAPDAEAEVLVRGARDADQLRDDVARRVTGEPLAWITGSASFAGHEVRIDPGVYVPRPQTERVAAADASWALPQTGAVAFSLHCAASDAQAAQPRDPRLVETAVSTSCLEGKCGEGDFAADYMRVLKLGYVHGADGVNYLVKPRTDFWQSGDRGPGYYQQTGGENEKLEPGRTN